MKKCIEWLNKYPITRTEEIVYLKGKIEWYKRAEIESKKVRRTEMLVADTNKNW